MPTRHFALHREPMCWRWAGLLAKARPRPYVLIPKFVQPIWVCKPCPLDSGFLFPLPKILCSSHTVFPGIMPVQNLMSSMSKGTPALNRETYICFGRQFLKIVPYSQLYLVVILLFSIFSVLTTHQKGTEQFEFQVRFRAVHKFRAERETPVS